MFSYGHIHPLPKRLKKGKTKNLKTRPFKCFAIFQIPRGICFSSPFYLRFNAPQKSYHIKKKNTKTRRKKIIFKPIKNLSRSKHGS